MKDQYNREIPSDLVLLDNHWIDELPEQELERVIKDCDWYELESPKANFLFVSAAQVDKCIQGLVDFCGAEEIVQNPVGFNRVDDVLKRWSATDGFYHN